MPVRLARPIAGLLVLLALLPGALAAQAPEATPPASPVATDAAWRIADERELAIDARIVALSPDGRWLAGVGPDDTICVWDVATLDPQCADERLPIREETITWSPDGTAVAFALDAIRLLYDSDIHVYERETGELVNLTDDGIEGDLLDVAADTPIDDVPTWSPDSQRIAFARSFTGDEEPGSTSIMRIDRGGGEPTEVARLDVDQPLTVWMPMHWLADGALVYSQISNDLGDPNNGVWTIDVEGDSRPVLVVPGGEDSDVPGPMVTDVADGKAIVYAYFLAAQFSYDVDQPLFWMVDTATGEREPLQVPGDGWVIDAGFSPDGSTALLVTRNAEGLGLMTLDVATGAIASLDAAPRDDAFLPGAPQWAANDTVLLQRPEGPLLVTLEPAGASPVASPAASSAPGGAAWQVLDERELDIETRHAALSPDGQWVAGVTYDDTFCIWEVVTLGSDCLDEPLPVRGVTITWSPDSTAVAFALDVALKLVDSDIYVVERESGALVNLTDDGAVGGTIDFFETGVPVDDMPAWSPDSQRIAFTRSTWHGETSSTSIMLVDRAGGEPVETLPLPGDTPLPVWMPMHWLPDGTLVYSQTMSDAGDPANGVWKVGVDDGGNPLRIVPGGAESEIPTPLIDDATSGRAIVYSQRLVTRLLGQDQPVFWLLDVASGETAPIRTSGGAMVFNAGLSPDGNTALLVVNVEGDPALMVMDVATGEIAPLGDVPRDDAFLPGAPQWAANNTVLLQRPTGIGPVLLTLEPAG